MVVEWCGVINRVRGLVLLYCTVEIRRGRGLDLDWRMGGLYLPGYLCSFIDYGFIFKKKNRFYIFLSSLAT